MKRVLVFNFFAGVMDRGIPLYAEDVAECMRRVGIEAVELRCPRWLRRAPRFVRNFTFAWFEQIVAPALRVQLRCSLTVYPYNSAGIIDALLGRSVLVVHDLIPNRLTNLAAWYICVTQTIHRLLGRPVCAASEHTLKYVRRLPVFKNCSLQLWSNPFYSFEAALDLLGGPAPQKCDATRRVLLCSGLGGNKDYPGALKLFSRSRSLADAELRVLGFGDDAHLAQRRVSKLPPQVANRITILPRLTLSEVVGEYLASDLVWVHSHGEGFGRCIVEGRLTGRPVVASNICAFRKLVGPGVHLYPDGCFDVTVSRALEFGPTKCLSTVAYHAPLEAAVREVVALYCA